MMKKELKNTRTQELKRARFRESKSARWAPGFTLTELLVALIVASIVLAAVGTLANAAISAKDATDNMGRSQAHLRMISQRFTILIQTANAILSNSEKEFQLWHDLNLDGLSSSDELTRILTDDSGNGIEIEGQETYANCTNVKFACDKSDDTARFVTMWFDLEENGVTQTHSVNAKLRTSAEHKQF